MAEGDLETGQDNERLGSIELSTHPRADNGSYEALLNHSDSENGPSERGTAVPATRTGKSVPLRSGWDDISLDSQSDIAVWEFQPEPPQQGGSKWVARGFKPGLETLKLDDKVAVRLFLVEGVTEKTIRDIMAIPDMGVGKEFFRYHCLNDLASNPPEFQKYFFAKWPRCFSQNPRQWKIEAKIAAKRPWDLENIVNPADLCQDHDWYSNVQRVYRPHAPLESKPAEWNGPPAPVNPKAKRKKRRVKVGVDEKDRFQAAGECVSYYFQKVNGGFIGNVSLKPPPLPSPTIAL
jgi:hypothetical protein